MQATTVISFPCPACEATAIDRTPERGRMVECPFCRYRTRRPEAKPFTRRDWDASRDPRMLREVWRAAGKEFTQRKSRLIACGVARIGFDWCRNVRFQEAVAYGEAQADGLSHPGSESDLMMGLFATKLGVYEYPSEDWGRLAIDCVQCNLKYPAEMVFEQYPGVVLGVYHDLLPNPFVRITWNPVWFTSTVHDLAAHIYVRREFTALPILADALQDAGCDNEQILNHCRANKPHARGCWVLDAILGKA